MGRRIPTGFDGSKAAFKLSITSSQLVSEKIEQVERLLEDKEMFLSPIAGQGFDDGSLIGLTARLAESSQDFGVPFTGDNGPQDMLAGNTGNIRQNVMEL